MLEIIPNWHPIFVHFTVALFSLSVGLFVIASFVRSSLRDQWLIVARWTLWFGAGFTVITGLTGLYAYNTVAHDTPSHLAMTDHRNWAIATMVMFLGLTVSSIIRFRRQQALSTVFVVLMAVAGGLLSATAWHGGEVVYRFGLGVMSLPQTEGEGHSHEHAGGGEHEHSGDLSLGGDSILSHDDKDSHRNGASHGHDEMSMDDMDMSSMGDVQSDGHDHKH